MDAFWTSLSNMIGGQSLLHAITSSDLSVLSTLSQHHRLVLAVGRIRRSNIFLSRWGVGLSLTYCRPGGGEERGRPRSEPLGRLGRDEKWDT